MRNSWVRQLLAGLLAWLLLWETLAARRGWHGLRWLPQRKRRRGDAFAAPTPRTGEAFAAQDLLQMRKSVAANASPLRLAANVGIGILAWRAGPLALALTALPGTLLQLLLASLRHPELDPQLRLRPGQYAGYRIERLDIALPAGLLPALHIVPHGGAQQAVCVLHGSGSTKTTYIWPLVDALTARGVALLLLDLDGHGENLRPQRFPRILENPLAGVAWLRQRYAHVTLLGISLGGCIAARAVADGLAVDRLVILEAPPRLVFGRGDIGREALAIVQRRLFYLFTDCTPQHLVRAWGTPGISAEISTWDLIVACELCGALGGIAAPLLMVYGGRDAIVKPVQAAEVWRALPPHAQFVTVDGASHLTLPLTPAALRAIGDWVTGAKLPLARAAGAVQD